MEEVQVLLSTYGLWFVALVVTADQLGIPIPAPPALVVCGGLVGTGQLDAGATLLAATLPALAADLLWFEIGRRKGHGVLRLLCRISLEPDSCVRSTRASFERRGPKTLLFAKFVPGLQTIAPPLACWRPSSQRSNPAAMTVTRTSSPISSSITVPKMMLASSCAASSMS